MKIKNTYIYLSLFIFQCIVSVYAFKGFAVRPHGTFFDDRGDGVKNYFTLYTYVNDSTAPGEFFKYNRFNYPFGDYVYSTDNTPGFSIPFKWFSQNIHDVSDDVLVWFNVFIILNIVIASLLLYYIFCNLLGKNFFSVAAAIMLPWVNMQIPRIWNGHYNLSLTSLSLGAICLLIAWHKSRHSNRRLSGLGLGMFVLCFMAFMFHGYYIAIITMFISGTLLFYGLLNRKESFGKTSVAAAVMIPALTVGTALLLMYATDPYLALRKAGAMGYDYHEMKTRVYSFFTPYYFHRFYFPIRSVLDGNHEHAGYLGNIGLYGCATMGIIAIFNKEFRGNLKAIQKAFFADKFKFALVLGALLMLSVSMGESYWTGTEGYQIYNILNPFFYLHQITDAVEQFRSLARFNWPFYFVFNVWCIYTIYHVYLLYCIKVKRIIVVLFLLIGYVELKDYVNEIRASARKSNVLAQKPEEELNKLNLDFGKYQAILPVPYYTAGSEVFDYILDDYDPWAQYTYRLSLYTGLPLMSCRLSRTPPIYVKALVDLFAEDKMYGFLYDRLNDKPILIPVHETYLTLTDTQPRGETQKKFYFAIADFVHRKGLKPIDSLTSGHKILFYEWYPKKAYRR